MVLKVVVDRLRVVLVHHVGELLTLSALFPSICRAGLVARMMLEVVPAAPSLPRLAWAPGVTVAPLCGIDCGVREGEVSVS